MGSLKRNKRLPKPTISAFVKGPPGSGISSSKTTSGDFIRGFRDGSDLIKEGKYEKAENVLIDICKRFKDDNYLAVLFLADALFFQKRYKEAEELYRGCVELVPVIGHARYELALVLKKTGRIKEAQKYEEVLSIVKDLPMGSKIPEYLPPL